MNPRYPFGVYTISNRARSASYATSPYRFLLVSLDILQYLRVFVKPKFCKFQGTVTACAKGTRKESSEFAERVWYTVSAEQAR